MKSKITFHKWLTKKPKFDCECIVVKANKWSKEWHYETFIIRRVEFEDKWYWGLHDNHDYEVGPITDLKGGRYYVMPIPK